MKVKKCSKCHKIKNIDKFYKRNIYNDNLQSYCKRCHCQYLNKKYANDLNFKKNKKSYQVKKYVNDLRYRKRILKYHKEKYANNLNYRKQKHKNYVNWVKNNSEKYKILHNKKQAKRRQNLKFNLSFSNIINEVYDYHHINNNDVICIPRDLHQLYSGKNHRENLIYIIKQIYGDIKI